MLSALARFVERRACAVRRRPPYEISVEAAALHRRLLVADLHADPLMWDRDLLAVAKAAGPRGVALGSDFDGAVIAPFDAAGVPLITQALLDARVPEETIALMMGGNALRFLAERLPAR